MSDHLRLVGVSPVGEARKFSPVEARTTVGLGSNSAATSSTADVPTTLTSRVSRRFVHARPTLVMAAKW